MPSLFFSIFLALVRIVRVLFIPLSPIHLLFLSTEQPISHFQFNSLTRHFGVNHATKSTFSLALSLKPTHTHQHNQTLTHTLPSDTILSLSHKCSQALWNSNLFSHTLFCHSMSQVVALSHVSLLYSPSITLLSFQAMIPPSSLSPSLMFLT